MQPGIGTHINSTNQLMITLKLRYALECAKKCQNNMKETVLARTFHSLDVPLDTCKTFNKYNFIFLLSLFTFSSSIIIH